MFRKALLLASFVLAGLCSCAKTEDPRIAELESKLEKAHAAASAATTRAEKAERELAVLKETENHECEKMRIQLKLLDAGSNGRTGGRPRKDKCDPGDPLCSEL